MLSLPALTVVLSLTLTQCPSTEGFFTTSTRNTNTVYISPTCQPTSKSCFTLDMIPTTFQPSPNDLDLTLYFFPGTHLLSSGRDVSQLASPHNITVTLRSAGGATISCQHGAYIHFTGFTRLEINRLSFMNCGRARLPGIHSISGLRVLLTAHLMVTNCLFTSSNVEVSSCEKAVLQYSWFNGSVHVSAERKPAAVNGGKKKRMTLSVANCVFRGFQRHLEYKGTLRVENLQQVTIANVSFHNRHTLLGALDIRRSMVSVSQAYFGSNFASICSAMSALNSSVNITASVFLNNSVRLGEGILCAINSIIRITNVSITRNSNGEWQTGGLQLARSKATLKNIFFDSNTGYDGGAIYMNNSQLVVQNALFLNNKATHSGGAIFAANSKAVFNNTFFSNNSDPSQRTFVKVKSRFVKPGGECSDTGSKFQCRSSKVQSLATLSGECNSLQQEILNEGKHPCMYKDSRNIPTIGIGFNLRRSGARRDITSVGADYDKLLARTQCLSDYQIQQLFNRDMAEAVSCAQRFVGSNWYRLGVTRQSAVADMAFNLGCSKLSNFTKFRAALQSTPPNYRAAVREMQDSRWCRQVKGRCGRNVACMR